MSVYKIKLSEGKITPRKEERFRSWKQRFDINFWPNNTDEEELKHFQKLSELKKDWVKKAPYLEMMKRRQSVSDTDSMEINYLLDRGRRFHIVRCPLKTNFLFFTNDVQEHSQDFKYYRFCDLKEVIQEALDRQKTELKLFVQLRWDSLLPPWHYETEIIHECEAPLIFGPHEFIIPLFMLRSGELPCSYDMEVHAIYNRYICGGNAWVFDKLIETIQYHKFTNQYQP